MHDVKKRLNQIYRLLDIVEGNFEKLNQIHKYLNIAEDSSEKPNDISIGLKKSFETDLRSFLMYLAASDGRISRVEKEFMNELFDVDMSTQDYADFINTNEIYSTKFEESLPPTLKVTIAFDKKFQTAAIEADQSVDMVTMTILSFYAELGEMFINLEGASENEEDDLNLILHNFMAKWRMEWGLSEEESLDEEEEDAVIVGGKKQNS